MDIQKQLHAEKVQVRINILSIDWAFKTYRIVLYCY